MKKKSIDINIDKLMGHFSGQANASKAALREFYSNLYPGLSEQDFRRILYSLEKKQYLSASGSGIYVFQPAFSSQGSYKEKFIPAISPWIDQLNAEIKRTYPYLGYLFWETKVLHEFMLHQPWQNYVMVEVEKGTEDSIFDFFAEKYPGQVFLDPDRLTIERYVLQQTEPVIVSGLVSQTPVGKKVGGIPYAKLEKILVDLLVDDDKFFIFQGQELISIFENAFSRYLIDEKSLLRYAGRRNAISRLKQFVKAETQVKLNQID